jgi:hypothetical protein
MANCEYTNAFTFSSEPFVWYYHHTTHGQTTLQCDVFTRGDIWEMAGEAASIFAAYAQSGETVVCFVVENCCFV